MYQFCQAICGGFLVLGIVFIIILTITILPVLPGLVFYLIFGESGPKHKCIYRNSCPGSVRCSGEQMDCYNDKEYY